MNMVTSVKSNVHVLGKVKELENSLSFSSNVDLGYCCGSKFLGLLAIDEVMLDVS